MLSKPLVIYDGSCSVCAGNLPWLHRLDWLNIFEARPYQDTEVYTLCPGLTPDACKEALHVVFPHGRMAIGADALRAICLRMPMTCLCGLMMYIPPLPWLSDRLYRLFARNRHHLGGHGSGRT